MPKSYRIRTEVGVDKYINVELDQDFEFLEILSLKILSNDVYTRFCSDYGVVVGRVTVNNGYGVPNARVSVFIPLEEGDVDNPVISELYPYQNLTSRNEEGYRYNLLPKEPSYLGHQATGTFPTRADVLMDSSYVEVYDKYYRFTVKTNESGDFMIFGVPVGEQTIVMDVDLSDIGCFSLSPQDLIQQGIATEAQVDGAQFKTSTNLDSLPQIQSFSYNIDVRPLWGDTDICQVGINRLDFDLTKLANIVIEPYAVFMGSILSTTDDDALSIQCRPKNDTGNLCELITGPGQVLAIRQTIFADTEGRPVLEQYQLPDQGKIIDDNGTFVASVPMNLDYITTNEFGEQILSNDPSKGIPTKGKYRFKFRWINKEKTISINRFQQSITKFSTEIGLSDDEYSGSFQRAGFLVPNIKEHGWISSTLDPLSLPTQTTTYTIAAPPVGSPTPYPAQTGPTLLIGVNVGWQFVQALNNQSFQIFIDYGTGQGFQPYYGGVESIDLPAGSQIYIQGTPVGNNPQVFTFNEIPQQKFDLYRSYAFSLDWDDYADVQSAIDCEDTFYQFNYNKVYTTALFIDRYKNGIGRARHLGIKEIDNRTCKTTNNTFPVNDVIKNFDPIFFVFNLLLNVLTLPFIIILWLIHFVGFAWPFLKLLAIGLVGWLTYNQIQTIGTIYAEYSDCQATAATFIALGLPSGAVMQTACVTAFVANLAYSGAIILLLSTLLVGLGFLLFKRLKIPRLGLPMINYPDCQSCDCACNEADLDDDFTLNSFLADINEQVQNSSSGTGDLVLIQPSGFLAPINSSGAYDIGHPNLYQNPQGSTNVNNGPFDCGSSNQYQSFEYLLNNGDIDGTLVARANQDFIRLFSGYDVLSSSTPIKLTPNEKDLLHAPQPFLFAAKKNTGPDDRWFAFPITSTYPQRLNEFNTRDKYFGVNAPNRVGVTVNPQFVGSQPYEDQVFVMLANPGTMASLTPGTLFSFQNPNYYDQYSTNRRVNLTGGTLNQFNLNSITGVTFTGQTGVTINYADPSSLNSGGFLSANIILTATSLTQILSTANNGPTTLGVNGYEESFLKYPTDVEYFQAITGLTVGNFLQLANLTNQNLFPAGYLLHKIKFLRPGCDLVNGTPANIFDIYTVPTSALQAMYSYENYEIIICTRGVDAHTQKQTIEYDLSRIYGHLTPNTVTLTGKYHMNVPIQGYPINANATQPAHPISHLTSNNQGHNLYFPSFSLSITGPTPSNPNFTAFTSNLPFYYLATDDNTTAAAGTYTSYVPTPLPGFPTITMAANMFIVSTTNYLVPYNPPPQTTVNFYFGGGTFIGSNGVYGFNNLVFNSQTALNYFLNNTQGANCNSACEILQYYYFSPPTTPSYNFKYLNFLYSAAYYRTFNPNPINFNSRNYLVMRSDRLPTSTKTENGTGSKTGYGLHQNNSFIFYTAQGQEPPLQIQIGLELINGGSYDEPPAITALTETLQCEGIVPLSCYSGNGHNWGIIPYGTCSVPEGRVINGCYCLLNKDNFGQYLINGAFDNDLKLLLEWKVRFTMNFALCRGVFAQVFQNNWVNGALYMFSFNTRKIFGLDPTQPLYNTKFYKAYCDDVIVYNDISNNFYYRSSPWSDTINEFIGKNSPATSSLPSSLLNFPGAAYNFKQIQFPTTVVDLGPRDSFIKEICSNPAFGSYYVDQVDTTSYQDNSNLLLLSFLSRLLNLNVASNIQPTSVGTSFQAGTAIDQFFDSRRRGYRIDGDIAQMLSINSEWKVSPFITENLPPTNTNQYIFLGTEGNLGAFPSKPVFGVFFSSSTSELRYRKIMAPGIETYNQTPLIQDVFGYPKSQVVPHYKWVLFKSNSIFGTENNNWYTNTIPAGFFKKEYQNLDFFTLGEKYITQYNQSQGGFGFITNFDSTVVPPLPEPNFQYPPLGTSGVIQGQPVNFFSPNVTNPAVPSQGVVVGAPYHFYFGLFNGKTAIDRFYKLYVPEF
jgi:hypothetical protein